jgi:hypothetical protein
MASRRENSLSRAADKISRQSAGGMLANNGECGTDLTLREVLGSRADGTRISATAP